MVLDTRAQSRIAGGEVADIIQYPFATALLNNIGSTSFRQVCGGTILSSTAILSAASCFVIDDQITPARAWRARVGSTSSETRGLLYIISRITTHPLFASATRVNDIAVIRTTATIAFSAAVQPAYIAGGAYKTNANEQVMAIGWGATSDTGPSSPELRHVQLWLNDQHVCADRYETLNFTVTDAMLCAGWLDVGIRGQCAGDTGGPLLHNDVVVGVFSWSHGCAHTLFPNINTRVAPLSRWIEAIATA
ncbi:trypsin CFT-1-like [Maniola jurtina]|uniref:trypsin CFT-1-like n=1 Tax=Maniola jurtina TaxID=191418 RepID=UPI001E6865B9|nr:trypsin CFT-1-like [Maniola jurtina]